MTDRPIADLVASIAARYGARIEPETGRGDARRASRPSASATDAREHARASQRLHTLASVPRSYDFATIGSPALAKLLGPERHTRLAALASSPVSWVTIAGPTSGAGKTAAAIALFRAWVARAPWPSGYFTRISAATEAEDHRSFGEPAPELVRAKGARVVVLDELGGEEDAERHRAMVADLVWHRFESRGPRTLTIVTTALEPAAITARYGEGMTRRLFEVVPGSTARLAIGRERGAK